MVRLAALMVPAVVIAVLAGVWLWIRHSPPQGPTVKQVTYGGGSSGDPVLSPDGKLVAYAWDPSGNAGLDIWVKPLREGEALRITRHEAHDGSPDFSPDGAWIAFRSFRDGGGIYMVPSRGGEERKLVAGGFWPRFSPDGRWIAYVAVEEPAGGQIYVIPFQGGKTRKMSPELDGAIYPVWSPDGKRLLFPAASRKDHSYDLWIAPFDPEHPAGDPVPVRTGVAELLRRQGSPQVDDRFLLFDWTGGHILFESGGRLWQLPLSAQSPKPQGPAVELAPIPGVFRPRVGFLADGRRVVLFGLRAPAANIWSLHAEVNTGSAAGDLRQMTHDGSITAGVGGSRVSLSADGQRWVVRSRKSGRWDIWLKDEGSGTEFPLNVPGEPDEGPIIHPSGNQVAYTTVVSGKRTLYLHEVHSRAARTVCVDCGRLRHWSLDQQTLLTIDDDRLSAVDIRTGGHRVILQGPKYFPCEAQFSPDGNWIALVTSVAGRNGQFGFVVPFDGAIGEEANWIPVVDEPYHLTLHWSPDGNLLYYFKQRDGFRCLWAQRLERSTKRPVGAPFAVRHFHGSQRYPWGGSWIAIARAQIAMNLDDTLSDIFMMELPGR